MLICPRETDISYNKLHYLGIVTLLLTINGFGKIMIGVIVVELF